MSVHTNLFHVVVLPLLIYASWTAYEGRPASSWIYMMFVVLASVGLLYHLARLSGLPSVI